ncbi:glycosyltransferase family 2 protein [Anaeromicropila populeti]|uniref:Glycosyl transferase family 2 n=1 Tax=Anaeromicropila populeti TaxID=37658 RepID=A0A1I6HUM2_9FIRM|nr:glycosyltransferase family 2 protein [Anaeromicropila populeti]SFR58139.1 Glycosyl transferase family 2 [Anaeromicropila populeti]
MITISLCMIVKNEEKVLARCLDSICDLMDEIIIVDTGSTDRTKEIAACYTDKIYDFQWNNDFSAARNFSFTKASKEYIYVADADEVIDEENREKFRILKEAMVPEVEIVQMYYTNQLAFGTTYNFDEEYRPKLYKRLREFMWVEPVHEAVNLEPVIFDSEIRIQHLPLSNHSKRDFGIFKKIMQDGNGLSKKLHNMYAKELFISGEKQDFIEAADFFEASASDSLRSEEEVLEAICVLVKTGRLENDMNRLLKYALRGVATQSSSEICFEVGEYFYQKSDFAEAVLWFYNAAFETECILNIRYGKEFPFARLAECYRRLGNETEAKEYEKLLVSDKEEGII